MMGLRHSLTLKALAVVGFLMLPLVWLERGYYETKWWLQRRWKKWNS